MKVEKQARLDAFEYARSRVFFGEGAGIRRRLIDTTVAARQMESPAYARAFQQALAKQDMVKHAKAAKKERRWKDTGSFFARNGKAVMRGDRKSADALVIAAVIGAYYAHQAGLDQKAWQWSKNKYAEAKAWVKGEDPVYSVTNVQN